MPKKKNFITDIQNSMEDKKEEIQSDNTTKKDWGKIIIERENKDTKKQIPVYLKKETLDNLTKICKRSGKNRNDIITLFIEYGIANSEIE